MMDFLKDFHAAVRLKAWLFQELRLLVLGLQLQMRRAQWGAGCGALAKMGVRQGTLSPA